MAVETLTHNTEWEQRPLLYLVPALGGRRFPAERGKGNEPRAASSLRILCLFFLAESGSPHDAAASQRAKDVHDPDHHPVQVCLPGPHPIPAKLQTHLISSVEHHLQTTSGPHRWGQMAGTGLPEVGAQGVREHHVLFYMR